MCAVDNMQVDYCYIEYNLIESEGAEYICTCSILLNTSKLTRIECIERTPKTIKLTNPDSKMQAVEEPSLLRYKLNYTNRPCLQKQKVNDSMGF